MPVIVKKTLWHNSLMPQKTSQIINCSFKYTSYVHTSISLYMVHPSITGKICEIVMTPQNEHKKFEAI